MNLEEVRSKFSQACVNDDIETAGFIFSKHLDIESKFSQATFEQGLILAVQSGALAVARYLLDEQNFNTPHKISTIYYCSLFDCQNDDSNLDMLQCLCFQLPDKEELLKIQEHEDFINKDHFVQYLSTRIEKEKLEQAVVMGATQSCEALPARRFKI